MKALIGLAALFYVLAIGPARAQSDSVFYYHQGQRTWLKIDTTKLLIKFQNLSASDGFNIIKDSFPEVNRVGRYHSPGPVGDSGFNTKKCQHPKGLLTCSRVIL
ncbi:MAG: hypothetical protein HRF51_02205 [bacterium]|jgi:hypothetical protein